MVEKLTNVTLCSDLDLQFVNKIVLSIPVSSDVFIRIKVGMNVLTN
jgi:hypothetical protein